MPLHLSPKQARKLKLIPADEQRAPKPATQPRRASYTSLGLLGWQFTTEGRDGESVYAWRPGGPRTALLPAGDGDDLGKHYRPAVEAVERGEFV